MGIPLLQVENLSADKGYRVPGYYVASTAPTYVEGNGLSNSASSTNASSSVSRTEAPVNTAARSVKEIAQYLYAASHTGTPELILSIHGYNTSEDYAKQLSNTICDYVNQDAAISQSNKKLLFVSYRWPSDMMKFSLAGLQEALQASPIALAFLFMIGGIGLAIGLVPLILAFLRVALWVLLPSLLCFLPIATLILLRLSAYFQDVYRATNFGVPDLVEFVRQVDQELVQLAAADSNLAPEVYWDNQNHYKIKLTFIGHSMGGFVTTHAVRILSDVFDARSIGTLDTDEPNKFPPPDIGRVFSLGRLILISPDIPIDAILSGRSNFLLSALRRFEEAYLFSNEGDMVLRLASTAANSFSFPNRRRETGSRLGNVAIRNQDARFGIVNLSAVTQKDASFPVLEYLFINPEQSLGELQEKYCSSTAASGNAPPSDNALCQLFTFFDCTDYKDFKDDDSSRQPTGILTQALRRDGALRLPDYLRLVFIEIPFRKLDTHGGYFKGKYSKTLIYRLAFLSFGGFLDSLADEAVLSPEQQAEIDVEVGKIATDCELKRHALESAPNLSSQQQQQLTRLRSLNADSLRHRLISLYVLGQQCDRKGIQILLSPERYQVDVVQQTSRSQFRQRVLQA